MHPDLSSHLHTEECNLIIAKLNACHSNNPFGKFWGVCNTLDREVYKCLMREREANRKKSAEDGNRRRLHSRPDTSLSD